LRDMSIFIQNCTSGLWTERIMLKERFGNNIKCSVLQHCWKHHNAALVSGNKLRWLTQYANCFPCSQQRERKFPQQGPHK
jgi:hypothetical protein